ncbi:DUF4184 family protein [Streptomyces sp. CAU 1734]|uniref:DUF4184 family protein n=1 Tax=Streptomyces sp. CAU 1734 TaxID=3140360 RepID=UPI0032615842
MPFTLSHIAAVLPGIRRDGTARGPLVTSALVMGSLSPDMAYFAATVVPGAMRFGQFTHAPVGVLTADVAVTTALVAVWVMVRDPLVALLPPHRQGQAHGWLRGRRMEPGPAYALRFYVSAVLGAATHVVWDAFTHQDRWGTRLVPVLGEEVAGYGVFTFAQYGSSALALILLGWFARSALRRRPASGPPPGVPVLDARERRKAVALIGGCVLLGAVVRCVVWLIGRDPARSPLDAIPTLCFGAGAGLVAGLVIHGAAMRLRDRTPQRV